MKPHEHKWLLEAQAKRRDVLKGVAGVGATAALGATGALGAFSRSALAQGNLRTELLKIPGVGVGSPTDRDWQEVGRRTLGPTMASVAEGEFRGVELTFLGLNNQNLHN